MSSYSILAVGVGAAIGACLRWWLAQRLNPVFPSLPLGTLAANLLGGYFMGIALFIINWPISLPQEVELLLTTGFLGGLTTFSTFSGETVIVLLEKEYPLVFLIIISHVAGSLMMTYFGIVTMEILTRKG